ncbi:MULTISPECIES: hypothetical protein [Dokdonia]|uniref:Uncharacterized protein n=2 Tax=Dokdonia TaxID=326319 RepID=A0A0A2GT85_9FLAO|nr:MULTISPECIES: hypothetical protein [Dokdonia]ANH59049.1 hypothetical protein I597_0114 [Dokdonia donghaensis DSW-1]AOE07653.1 hypothetical protein [uncultured bacterium]KGO06479.1 hypothetical protein NV36_06265 [Dokdonia donghaensis DSW-1]
MTRKKIILIFIILLILLLVLTVSKLNFENLSWSINASIYQQLITMALMFLYLVYNYRKQ